MKQNTFTYGHQGSQHSNADALVLNKTNSRNGPRGESFNENGGPGGSNFNGDTGHDYNFQQQQMVLQQQELLAAADMPRRQIAAMTGTNSGVPLGGSQSKSRGRQL